jgi:hypothetical protein
VHRAEEDVPGPAGEGLEADGQRRQDVRHVDPAPVPPNATIGRDPPDLEASSLTDRAICPDCRREVPWLSGINRHHNPHHLSTRMRPAEPDVLGVGVVTRTPRINRES